MLIPNKKRLNSHASSGGRTKSGGAFTNDVIEELTTKRAGEFICQQSQIARHGKAAKQLGGATFKALEATKVLVLSGKNLTKFLAKCPEHAPILKSILTTDVGQLLSDIPFFCNVKADPDTIRQGHLVLSDMFTYENRDAGETIIKKGDAGDCFYIVVTGSVSVWVGDGEIADKKTVTLGKKEFFGETALMVNMARSATIKAEERCLFLTLKRAEMTKFFTLLPGIEDSMSLHLRENLLQNFRARGISIFVNTEEEDMPLLASLCRVEEFKNEEYVFYENDPADRFYIVVAGEVEVISSKKIAAEAEETPTTDEEEVAAPVPTKGKLRAIKSFRMGDGVEDPREGEAKAARSEADKIILKAGQYFGEVALVMDGLRNASIQARGENGALLLSIGRTDFQDFFSRYPAHLAEFQMRVMNKAVGLKQARLNFREFLAAEHAEENLLFWQDAELYRLIDPMASSGSRKPRTHSDPEVESAQMREYRGSFIAGSKLADQLKDIMADKKKGGVKQFTAVANAIYHQYVAKNADLMINISSGRAATIKNEIDTNLVNIDTFLSAQEEIFKVMKRDNFARYKKSEYFEKLIASMDTYSTTSNIDAAEVEAKSSSFVSARGKSTDTDANPDDVEVKTDEDSEGTEGGDQREV